MWVFMFIPIMLYLVAGIGELIMQWINDYREDHPSIRHLKNKRRNDCGAKGF